MTEPLARLGLLVGIVAALWLATVFLGRRRPRRRHTPGITVITSAACRTCQPTVESLRRHGPELSLRLLEAGQPGADVLSVPTVVVADGSGAVVLRRSGRSALTDAPLVVETARRLLGGGA